MPNHCVSYYPSGIRFSSEKFGSQLCSLTRQIQREQQKSEILFLCIGSDRSTGDSLGPLVGHLLSKNKNFTWEIMGTLKSPVHATNFTQALERIKKEYDGYLIIAVDASIGKKEHISKITLSKGSISPGLGVHKKLERIGDIAITGIVGSGSCIEPLLLQNTRLSMIMELADCISRGIVTFDKMRKKQKNVERFLVRDF